MTLPDQLMSDSWWTPRELQVEDVAQGTTCRIIEGWNLQLHPLISGKCEGLAIKLITNGRWLNQSLCNEISWNFDKNSETRKLKELLDWWTHGYRWEGGVSGNSMEALCHPLLFALHFSFILLFLSCILHNNTVSISIALPCIFWVITANCGIWGRSRRPWLGSRLAWLNG